MSRRWTAADEEERISINCLVNDFDGMIVKNDGEKNESLRSK
jgi:hypothetical protein